MSSNTTSVPINPINYADTTWVLICTALVMIMIPGVGYYYGGNSRNKDKLTVLLSSFTALSVISLEWFLWGYSLSFSETGGKFIGDLRHIVLTGVGNDPTSVAPTIPANCYMIYQCMFSCVTGALVYGSVTERSSLRCYVVFLFFWSVFVYDIVAYWTWAQNGWLHTLGALDYAGGTPVHIVSGMSSLAYAIIVGPRKGFKEKEFKPVNLSDLFIGTVLLWFGWFGFNAGSGVAINSRAVNAFVVTNLSASLGGICWCLMDMVLKRTRKISLYGFCSGAIAGLVAITPASGYVSPPCSLVFGSIAGALCCASTRIKNIRSFPIDDASDVFAVHGVGGIIGGLLTGVFADANIAKLDGTIINGGWINQNYIQLLYQLIEVAVGAGWSFVVSLIILFILNCIPFLNLRVSERQEERGTDLSELTERSFGIDITDLNENFINTHLTNAIKSSPSYGQQTTNLAYLHQEPLSQPQPQLLNMVPIHTRFNPASVPYYVDSRQA